MCRTRFIIFAILSFNTALLRNTFSLGMWLSRVLTVALCTVLSTDSVICTTNLAHNSRQLAASSLAVERTVPSQASDGLEGEADRANKKSEVSEFKGSKNISLLRTIRLGYHARHHTLPILTSDGSHMIISYSDRSNIIRVWDLATGKLKLSLNNGTKVRSVILSLDKKSLISIGDISKVKKWNIATGKLESSHIGKPIFSIGNHRHFKTLAISPDGRTLVSTKLIKEKVSGGYSWRNIILVWDVITGQLKYNSNDIGNITDTQKKYLFKLIKSDTLYMSANGKNFTVHVGNVHPGKNERKGGLILSWSLVTGQVKTIRTTSYRTSSTSLDQRIIASSYSDKSDWGVKVWDLDKRKIKNYLKGAYEGRVSPDGKTFINIEFRRSNIKIFDIATGKLKFILNNSNNIQFVYMSPDGKYVVGNGNSLIRIWKVK